MCIAMLIAIALILAFVYITYEICRNKSLGFYFNFHWQLFCLLPLSIRIAIFIRLFLFIIAISSDGLDYILYTRPWELSSTPPTGSGSSSSGVVLPPNNGGNTPPNNGGNTPPSGGELGVNNTTLDSILSKLRIQTLQVGQSTTSIYSRSFTANAILDGQERQYLGDVVSVEEEAGRSGPYRVITKRPGNIPELRVVKINLSRPDNIASAKGDVQVTHSFIKFLENIP